MTTELISDDMRASVGRILSRRVSFPISDSDIRRWAIAVYWPGDPPRRYWDTNYASRLSSRGIVAPEEFNPFAWMVAQKDDPSEGLDPNDPDRIEKSLKLAGPGLKFQLNGGLNTVYGESMRPGDTIESVNRLVDYTERKGRLGMMLFTVSEDTWRNQRSDLVKRTRLTLIRY